MDTLTYVKPRVINRDKGLVLRDVACYGPTREIFEYYPTLYVSKDIERVAPERNDYYRNKLQRSIGHFSAANFGNTCLMPKYLSYPQAKDMVSQDNLPFGVFFPSLALTFNYLQILFETAVKEKRNGYYETVDLNAKEILDQHNTTFIQNTLCNWNGIYHYHRETGREVSFPYNEKGCLSLGNTSKTSVNLEDALKMEGGEDFLRELTGLSDLMILERLARYFSKGKPFALFYTDRLRPEIDGHLDPDGPDPTWQCTQPTLETIDGKWGISFLNRGGSNLIIRLVQGLSI